MTVGSAKTDAKKISANPFAIRQYSGEAFGRSLCCRAVGITERCTRLLVTPIQHKAHPAVASDIGNGLNLADS